jgi:signal transduction histidine kinase
VHLLRNEDVVIISDFSAVDEVLTLKSYLHSIFFNLISNSIKYRRHDVKPVIEIVSSKKENGIELLFRDNGLGIDMARKGEEIFGLYKRFHPHIEGKGVGLYMVKTQVETLGGRISLTSEVNKGTEFKILLETA